MIQNPNRVARSRQLARAAARNKPQSWGPGDQALYLQIYEEIREWELIPYSEEQHQKILDDEEIVAQVNEEYTSIADSTTENESDTFSLKHSSWKLYCADY